ncbi:hypothetical protein [Streptomyces sp. HUAS TT7]|uniref:hypothetical protein n=1 Tax=Streptomyces sp. HUAS TT7 TaxID=3447507 RepID=UPI003F6608E4
MDPAIVITVVSIVTAKVSAVFGLWLRLRWRARTEQAQQVYLARLSADNRGVCLEVDDHQGDGRRVRIRLRTAETTRGEDTGA